MSLTPIPLSYYANDWVIEQQKAMAGLQWSMSNLRWDPKGLEMGVIPAGTPIAVFVDDVYNAFMVQVDFELDSVFHNSETSAPWDYDGTDGFGNANMVTFPSGLHTIQATITLSGASFITPNPFIVTAQFQVL